MADNKLELVVEVDVDKANASIKSINRGLSSVEQAANTAAQGASRGIDGIAVSVAKGAAAATLLTGAFERVVGWVREYTVEAAKLAARNETLAVVNAQLARANGYNEDSIERLVGRIKSLGITTQASRDTVNKMIAAQLDLSRTTDLARLAQDAAVVAGQNSSEALQGIIHGITTQQIEVLRTYGINVQFEREFTAARQRLGRDLTDSERKNIAFQRVLAEAPKIAGAYEASLGTVGKQISSLERFTEEARSAIGERFLPEMRRMISGLTELAKWTKENAGAIALWAKGIAAAAIGAAIGRFISWVMGAKKGIDALTLSLARNPLTAVAIAATVAGTALWEMHEDSKQAEEQFRRQNEEAAEAAKILALVNERGKNLEDLQNMGYTLDQIRKAFVGAKAGAEDFMAGFDAAQFSRGIKIVNQKELEEIRKREAEELGRDIRKKQGDIGRDTLESALTAERAIVTGPARALLEMQDKAGKLAIFVDQKGVEHSVRLTAQTRENIERELRAKVAVIQREAVNDSINRYREEYEARLQFDTDLYERRLQANQQSLAKDIEHLERGYAFEEDRAGFVRDAQVRQLEAADAQTIAQKLSVEQRKMEIEVAYLERVHEIKTRLFDMETSRMVLEQETHLRQLGYDAERISARIADLTQQREQIRQQTSEQTDAAIAAARESSAIRQTQIVRDRNREVFESFKEQAGGVFDALLTRSQSVWSAIGTSLKAALLTAIKDVVTSRVAALLMQMFNGTSVSLPSGRSGGGLLGRLGGALGVGAVPVFGGGSVPITTPPFVPNSASPARGGGLLSNGGLAGLLPSLKSFAGIGGSVQLAPGLATTWQAATLGQKLSSIGHSDAALLGGGALALAGLQRGGVSGLAMTTAGGALIGYKYGGPVGAAIGAGAGAVAGIVRMFVKGRDQKIIDEVRGVYGVTIDKQFAKALAEQARGQDLRVFLRSPQIREQIEAYAMMTGQRMGVADNTPRGVFLAQQGGALYQTGSHVNNQGQGYSSSLPSLGSLSVYQPASSAPMTLSLKLDGPATSDLMEGKAVEVIASNPRAVQASTSTAIRSSFGRRDAARTTLDPLLVTG